MADVAGWHDLADGPLGVRERALTYEAQCRHLDQQPVSLHESSTAAQKLRSRFGVVESRATRPRWTLTSLSEQRILKAGVSRLQRDMVKKCKKTDPMELPRRKDGSSKVMKVSFFKRLLNDEVELKVCMECDVSSAQPDLRYLSTEQLLTLRTRTLNFSTDSQSHNAHRSFLHSLDAQLFDKLVRQLLRGTPADLLPSPDKLRPLGIRVTLVMGAIDILGAHRNDPGSNDHEDGRSMPACWAIKLDENDWTGCSTALLHTRELWLQPIHSHNPDFAEFTKGGLVAVASERSEGSGIDRRLHWEIVALDPCIDDVMAEVLRKEGAELEKLSNELSIVIKERCSTRRESLGLEEVVESRQCGSSPGPDVNAIMSSPEKGKVAAAIMRINTTTPPRTAKATPALTPEGQAPRCSFSTPSAAESKTCWSPDFECKSAPSTLVPGADLVLEGLIEASEPVEGLVVNEDLRMRLGSCEPDLPADDMQADSLLPCMCARSAGKPNVLCATIQWLKELFY